MAFYLYAKKTGLGPVFKSLGKCSVLSALCSIKAPQLETCASHHPRTSLEKHRRRNFKLKKHKNGCQRKIRSD
jgi:hypothetical protein